MGSYCGLTLSGTAFTWRSPLARVAHKTLRRLGLIAAPAFRPSGRGVDLSEALRTLYAKPFAALRDHERRFVSDALYRPAWPESAQRASYLAFTIAEDEVSA